MFGIGTTELLLILAIALIVIGPRKLPDLARSLGRAMGEFKKATGELKSSLGVDEELASVKNTFSDMNQEIKDAVNGESLTPEERAIQSVESEAPDPVASEESPAEGEDAADPDTEDLGKFFENITDAANQEENTPVKTDPGDPTGGP